MIPQRDPAIEELVAERLEQKRQVKQARDDGEYGDARKKMGALEIRIARELPAAEKQVAELREEMLRAQERYVAASATLDNEKSDLHSGRLHYTSIMARTMPAPWRQAGADLEETLAVERRRILEPVAEVRELQDVHVRGLQAARDQLDQLIGTDPTEMPKRIQRILGAVPPRYDGGPVKTLSFTERAAAGFREYLKARASGDTI